MTEFPDELMPKVACFYYTNHATFVIIKVIKTFEGFRGCLEAELGFSLVRSQNDMF